MTIPASLETLLEILGPENTQCFLTFAQPTIQQYQHELAASLQQQDWEAASALAHRFKATAHLYSTATLQHQLEGIIAKDIATLQHTDFLPQLMTEFQHIERDINIFLINF